MPTFLPSGGIHLNKQTKDLVRQKTHCVVALVFHLYTIAILYNEIELFRVNKTYLRITSMQFVGKSLNQIQSIFYKG